MASHDVGLAWPEGDARPAMTLSGETAVAAAAAGATKFHVSLACTRTLALAWVVLQGAGD
jgi:phosphopantetheinyl transferase (holo-ACP synthase)